MQGLGQEHSVKGVLVIGGQFLHARSVRISKRQFLKPALFNFVLQARRPPPVYPKPA